jgi:hypothetical protein
MYAYYQTDFISASASKILQPLFLRIVMRTVAVSVSNDPSSPDNDT